MPLLFVFILVPVTELYLLLKLGSVIGLGWTLLLILTTAFVGMTLLRSQGLATLFRAGERMRQGEIPMQELAEGFLLALAGALLITPGLLTDVVGFTLLAPIARRLFARRVSQILERQTLHMQGGQTTGSYGEERVSRFASGHARSTSNQSTGQIIEGEFEHHTSDEKK